VLGGLRWRQLSGGNLHSCGVTTDDKAYCWGNNGNGELGDGTRRPRLRPTAVTGGLRVSQIEAGNAYTCGVTTSHKAYCWGSGGLGQLGDGTTVFFRLQPRAVAGNRRFDQVNAGWNHTCGVTGAGRGFCWGHNNLGQLGDGSTENRSRPAALGTDLTLAQVGGGVEHSCGVTRGGQAYCWGLNNAGQLGDGTTTDHLEPAPVAAPI
jgi:alpha-tubulin suppressor-like RCC1 family protein